MFIFFTIKSETDFSFPNTPNLEAFKVMNGFPLKVNISQNRLYNVKIGIIDSGIDGKQRNLKLNEVNSSQVIVGNKTHGTTVASIIGAKKSEDLDFNGMLPGITLYTFDIQSNTLNTDTLSKAIDEMSQIGVKVINISLSTYKDSPNFKKSIESAVNRGITIVASAGNDSSKEYSYPASYEIPGVISVGALDDNLDVWSISNFNDTIDVFAPGTGIYAINDRISNNDIETFNGTSLSAPLVTTWVSLLLAINPSLTPSEVEKLIKETSKRRLVNWKQSRVYINMANINGSLIKATNYVE
ncbi:S8 family peptidase [Brevibacillus fluminis]|uniref:S8 family peptidase n=1 Tax=Brevibacillus fluminis TaxID=511487 RepID=UPI001606D1A5|nr:S8 family serine peptidase [Brevibacillus fluminis]